MLHNCDLLCIVVMHCYVTMQCDNNMEITVKVKKIDFSHQFSEFIKQIQSNHMIIKYKFGEVST